MSLHILRKICILKLHQRVESEDKMLILSRYRYIPHIQIQMSMSLSYEQCHEV